MRLSTVFELLLIFLFIAFAASRSVSKDKHHQHHHLKHADHKSRQATVTKPATAAPNRYCQCASLMCNCCRDFSLPVVSLKGPGCANVQYLTGDSMRLTMSFGDRILRNITLSGKKPRPVCMGLPASEVKFCGRIYGIQKVGDQFKACLALEMRALDEVEAALRVSCFKFGPDGVKLEPGRPVPTDTDDYDDDDEYGFDDEDDDDDDDDFLSDDDDEDEENDVDSGDYTGFSVLGDEFLDGFFDSSPSKKKKKPQPSTTVSSPIKVTKKPVASIATTTKTELKLNGTTVAPDVSKPGKLNNASVTTVNNMSEATTADAMMTSTEVSIKIVQDGNTLEEINAVSGIITASTLQPSTQEMTDKLIPTTALPMKTEEKKDDKGKEEESEDDEEEEEEEEDVEPELGIEDDEEEGSAGGETETMPPNKESNKDKEAPQAKDDDENILDGILGDDDDDDAEEDADDKEDEDDEDDDEFRQLRSHVPRGPYQPMTLEDQERQFPGLSALIKPPSVPFMTLQEQERRFPGLAALIRPPSVIPQQPAEIVFDFPPVRSARAHRRMRLPPI